VKNLPQKPDTSILFGDIRRIIEDARAAVAVTVNAGLTDLYWRIGKRINDEIVKGKRAAYGDEIVSTVSRQLEPRNAPADAEGSTDREAFE
jgi:hypothetical protein